MSIINSAIDSIEAQLDKLRSETQESVSPPEPVSQNSASPTALEQELAKVLTDMIPPTYDRTHPYAATWDAARAVLAKVGK